MSKTEMGSDEAALVKATGITRDENEDEQKYFARLTKQASNKLLDEEWETLPESAQKWCVENTKRMNKKKPLKGFGDDDAKKAEEPAEGVSTGKDEEQATDEPKDAEEPAKADKPEKAAKGKGTKAPKAKPAAAAPKPAGTKAPKAKPAAAAPKPAGTKARKSKGNLDIFRKVILGNLDLSLADAMAAAEKKGCVVVKNTAGAVYYNTQATVELLKEQGKLKTK